MIGQYVIVYCLYMSTLRSALYYVNNLVFAQGQGGRIFEKDILGGGAEDALFPAKNSRSEQFDVDKMAGGLYTTFCEVTGRVHWSMMYHMSSGNILTPGKLLLLKLSTNFYMQCFKGSSLCVSSPFVSCEGIFLKGRCNCKCKLLKTVIARGIQCIYFK